MNSVPVCKELFYIYTVISHSRNHTVSLENIRMRTQLEDFLWSNSWNEQVCNNWEHNGSGMFVKIKKILFCDNILNACIGRKGTGFEMDLTWKLVKRNTGLCLDKEFQPIFLLYLLCMQYFHLRWNSEQSCPCTWSSQMIFSTYYFIICINAHTISYVEAKPLSWQ